MAIQMECVHSETLFHRTKKCSKFTQKDAGKESLRSKQLRGAWNKEFFIELIKI
jgi:hypothetical protein